MSSTFLTSSRKQFEYYKMLGEKAVAQIADDAINWRSNEDGNSVSTIVRHMHGNMMSRWTDVLTTDGEKPWRERDGEFSEEPLDRNEVMRLWNEGWTCLFAALDVLEGVDESTIIYIRNQGHTIIDAVLRQIAHYAYHVGQIVYISKMLASQPWQSLSVPKNQSAAYNADKFAQPKRIEHFTDELLKK